VGGARRLLARRLQGPSVRDAIYYLAPNARRQDREADRLPRVCDLQATDGAVEDALMKVLRRWTRSVLAALGALIIVGIAYKATTMRRMSGQLTVDTGCESDPNTVAEMSQFAPGAASIRCRPWDIGTGVTGYVWSVPTPRAVLLIEHGWGDYAQRMCTRLAASSPQRACCATRRACEA
jgi:hypothetical protein